MMEFPIFGDDATVCMNDEVDDGKERVGKDQIDYYIFHQANKFMLNNIRKVCVMPKDKFYVNLAKTGNTVSSTVLIGFV